MPELKEPLSEREEEILRLVATGAANKEIARQLVISPNTVKVHLRNIFTKIGVASRTEATLYAVHTGLVRPGALQEQPEETAEEATGAVLLPQAAPAEADETVSSLEGQKAPRKIWRLALLALPLLLLVSVWAVSARLLAPPIATPPAAATAAPVQVHTRWLANPTLPAPRKGMGIAAYENAFYLIGGESAEGIDGVVLRYDLTKKAWQTAAVKPTPVSDALAALLGEKIYVPGGCLEDGSATSQLEVYDPRQDSWESLADLPEPRCAYALAAFEGQLYVFGGKNAGSTFNSVYAYNPQEDRWEERSPMDTPRAHAGAAVINGKIHIIGGFDGSHALDLNQTYLPTRDGNGEVPWESLTPLPEARYAMGITQLASMIYVLGGMDKEGQMAEAVPLQYNSQQDQWMTFEAPPVEVGALPALIASGDLLYILGGETAGGLSEAHQTYQAIYTIAVPFLTSDE